MLKKLLFILVTFGLVVNPYYASAEEITVSGNGEGSNSNININVGNNTNVTQDNTADVNNNVDITADTGNNTANENTGGDTSITTGNVDISSNIENTGINQSYVDVGCCPGNVDLNILSNGSDSNNNINYTQNYGTNVSVNNNANITNNVNGKANTGYNEASNNTGGNVSIRTGSIRVEDTIKNNGVNVYVVEASSGNSQDVSITIKENGSGSVNTVEFTDESSTNIDINNSATIVNESTWDLNTGGNKANGNTGGDVTITTGDILFKSTIENTGINVGLVDVDCCDDDKDRPGPDDNPPPPPPPGPKNEPNPPGPSTNPGQGGTTTQAGEVLPVTGAPSLLFLAIANVVMFFMGWYLRLRSGRSPNFAYAV